MRISEHCEVVPGPRHGAYPHGNPLRVHGSERTLQIDAARGTDFAGVDLVAISHYHEDHVVGVAQSGLPAFIHHRDLVGVQSAEGFAQAAGAQDAAVAQRLIDDFGWEPIHAAQPVEDGHVFDLGGGVTVRVVALPGHTGGHSGFFVEPDEVFYIGDIDLSSFGPLYADRASSLDEMRASLDLVRDTEAEVYVTAHHKGYVDRPTLLVELAKFRGVIDRREARIRELLAEGPESIDDMIGRGVVYREGTQVDYLEGVERKTISLHLAEIDPALLSALTAGPRSATELAPTSGA